MKLFVNEVFNTLVLVKIEQNSVGGMEDDRTSIRIRVLGWKVTRKLGEYKVLLLGLWRAEMHM